MKRTITITIAVLVMLNAFSQNCVANTTNSPYARLSSVGLSDVQWTKGF